MGKGGIAKRICSFFNSVVFFFPSESYLFCFLVFTIILKLCGFLFFGFFTS